MKNSSANRVFLLLLLAAAVLVTTAPIAVADGVTCRNGPGCLNGTVFFNWQNDYGPPFSPIPNGSIVQETSVNFAQGGNGERVNQGDGWNGNFGAGNKLLWTNSPGQGPLTFNFNPFGGGFGITGIGANIQTDSFGPFTALIQGFDRNGVLIASFSENGMSNGNRDGSAIFIGLKNTVMFSVTFSITSCTSDCNDFAINQLDIIPIPEGVPEPASVFLLGSGLGVLGGMRRAGKRAMRRIR